jgi:F0F1-type ATP synthase membrane subunit a
VIFLINISGWILDWVRLFFVDIEAINEYIIVPTTSFEFNIALAAVSIIITLIVQFKSL